MIKLFKFKVLKPITFSFLLEERICNSAIAIIAEYLNDHDIKSFDEPFSYDTIEHFFLHDMSWFGYAHKEGWVDFEFTPINDSHVLQDTRNGHLYSVTHDTESDHIFVHNISENSYQVLDWQDLVDHFEGKHDVNLPTETSLNFEMLNFYLETHLVSMEVKLRDIILKKIINKK